MRRCLLPLFAFLAACADAYRIPADAGVAPSSPPFDAAWLVSTHNAYWVDRGTPGDLFASGVGERLLDQLLFDHARGIEIDIHRDPASPGVFAVYHTTPGNGLCDTLSGCLAMLRAFHHALPGHEVVHVTLELKELTSSVFDASHTPDDLDRALSDELGNLLYRPSEFMARCPDVATLSDCARSFGWPETHALRGRFLVSVLGNWNGLPGAQATKDYIDYATTGDIRARAAFPMASSWQLDYDALTGLIRDIVTQDDLDRALAQSVFMQIEDTADPRLAPFLARRGVVRIDGAFSEADQQARIALGTQLLQTDSPWIQADDRGPRSPLRALAPGFSGDAMIEPGARLSLAQATPFDRVFAYTLEDASTEVAWETAVSSGAGAALVGCLRVATALGDDEGSVTVCRTKIPSVQGAPSADAERALVHVTACALGACDTQEFPSRDPSPEGPGDLLRIEVSNHEDLDSCVRVRSATAADPDLAPRWEALGSPLCFPLPLRYQGIATPSSAWFFGTRREASGVVHEVRAADFAGVVDEGAGASREAPELLSDE